MFLEIEKKMPMQKSTGNFFNLTKPNKIINPHL